MTWFSIKYLWLSKVLIIKHRSINMSVWLSNHLILKSKSSIIKSINTQEKAWYHTLFRCKIDNNLENTLLQETTLRTDQFHTVPYCRWEAVKPNWLMSCSTVPWIPIIRHQCQSAAGYRSPKMLVVKDYLKDNSSRWCHAEWRHP